MSYNRDKVKKYAEMSDIFHKCKHKTFDDSDEKASKANYVKKADRSDHKYAFTFQVFRKVVLAYLDELLYTMLYEAVQVRTPIGDLDIRRLKKTVKRTKDKVYKQRNVLNYALRLICKGNYYQHRSVTRVDIMSDSMKEVYQQVEKDTSVIFHLQEWR
jgi:hypothetical protein